MGIAANAAEEFTIEDKTQQKHLDILKSGKLLGRYMYDFDNSSGARREDTFKTYLQVFNANGDTQITKGLGGDSNHHRGIFTGWGKITIDGESFDCWHGHGAAQIHQDFSDVKADAARAAFTSRILWEKGKNGLPALEEKRTMAFLTAPEGAYAMVDFASEIHALDGKTVLLEGDPEHSGIQFRPANEIDRSKTLYIYPKEKADAHFDLDYPWLACSFVLEGKTYSVVYLNHPENPKDAKFSAYRDYGRFGAFFKASLAKDETLSLQVRFLMLESELPSAEWIQAQYNEYAGTDLPVPKTTRRGPS